MSSAGTFHVKLPPELLERLDRQAERRILSRHYLVKLAVSRLLEDLEDWSDELELEAGR